VFFFLRRDEGKNFCLDWVCEGVGEDERVGLVVFSFLAKLRRLVMMVEVQIDIYVATHPSILIINKCGHQ